ncbi:MAG: LysR family transcriptional regulator [Pseudomonadota bacterium]
MFDIRDMQLLDALARHRHFARAADECGISQPAFSSRIRNLESDLKISIVKRGNRFMGFTPEGEIALKWARKILLDADGMRQEITNATTTLEGRLNVGVIPTALAFVARVPTVIRARHPNLRVEITSTSSSDIKRGLDDFTFSAGVSYIDDAMPTNLSGDLLYNEEYLLLAPRDLVGDRVDAITWADAARLPLCLLSRTMQNRRIIEEIFQTVGADVVPVMETNALTVSLTQVEAGVAATIVPRVLMRSLPMGETVVALNLTAPHVQRPVGLLLTDREPVPPAHRVLSSALKELLD